MSGSADAAPIPLGPGSSVLAVVPHFENERWLGDCLESLLEQSTPLSGIVVIDDASATAPLATVRRYERVTLLRSTRNVGPYLLSQIAIDNTGYDGYLFQDADDWSLPHRLEALLETAAATGAELIGCQGYRILIDDVDVMPLTYPRNPAAAISRNPVRYAILHPTSLLARSLSLRIGGFATGLQFGGDGEFLHRAVHAAIIANAPDFCYVKRTHGTALTSRGDTGLRSDPRVLLGEIERRRAQLNQALVDAGKPPVLTPLAVSDPVPLDHLCGPRLRGTNGSPWPS